MKFFVDNWHLILVAFVSGGMLVWPMVRRSGGAAAVPTSEAVRLINREKGVLVDVSELHEYAAAHAGGARHIPLGQLEGSKELPSNKALPILLMCPTGARAARGAAQLRKAGYERAVAVAGGLNAWRDAQLPVERSEAAAAKAGKAGKSGKAEKAEKVAERGEGAPAAKAAAEHREGTPAQESGASAEPGDAGTGAAAQKATEKSA